MGSFSIWHWLIVLVVVLVLFGGKGKLSQLMGDMGKGVTSFKKGLKESSEEKEKAETDAEPPKAIDADGDQQASAASDGEAKDDKDKTAASG